MGTMTLSLEDEGESSAIRETVRSSSSHSQAPRLSASMEEVDVDDLMEERDLAAIAHELDQIDREAKGGTNLKQKPIPIRIRNSKQKERDAVGEDEEISPVLLMHLAAEDENLPGAFHENTRPPNLPQTVDARQQHSQSESQLIEASLVSPPNTVQSPFQEHSDIEQANLIHQDTPSLDTNYQIPTLVDAQDAKFSDFLQNRTFCLFFTGYLCAIVTISALIVVIIVMQTKNQSTDSFTNTPIHVLQSNVQVETQGVILAEYLDPVYNPSQSYAFQWLNSHPLLPDLPPWRKVQVYAFATFYFALHFMDWPPVDRTHILVADIPECLWNQKYGYEPCGSPNQTDYGVLQKLQLTGNGTEGYIIRGVTGTLPPQVAMLRSLHTIQIGYTDLNATLQDMLPTQLESLVNLTVLDYAQNQLQQSIPTRIARLQRLTSLSLHTNRLSASIPSQIGTMTRLTSLELDYNQLTGRMPTQLANLSSSLLHLSLRNNNLWGPLPPQIGSMRPLTSLMLQKNSFGNAIPTQIGLLTNLEILQLWGNQFLGPIPTELGLLASSLKFLDLHENDLTGTIPTELGLLTRLERLLVHDNAALTGAVPEELCRLESLKNFQVNCLQVDCDPNTCNCICNGF